MEQILVSHIKISIILDDTLYSNLWEHFEIICMAAQVEVFWELWYRLNKYELSNSPSAVVAAS